jgi:hypothetical protein
MYRTVRTTTAAALMSSVLICGSAEAAPIVSDRQIAPKPPAVGPVSAAARVAARRWSVKAQDGILVKSATQKLRQQAERLTVRPAADIRDPFSW